MGIPEKGIVYKASPRAYLGNYIIGAGVVALALIVVRKFEVAFTLVPSGAGELLNSLVYVAFFGTAAWLFAESFLEGGMRHYVISNSEVVKVEGVLWKRRYAIPYQSVAEVNVVKGLFGRIFNYGTVRVEGMREGGISIRHVSNPDEVRRLLRHRVDAVRPVTLRATKKTARPEKEDKDEDSLE